MSRRQISENMIVNAEEKVKRSKRLRNVPPVNALAVMENNTKRLKLEVRPTLNENDGRKSEDTPLSLTSLNDYVLLHVFRHLDWMDSITLAASCNRFRHLDYLWLDKKNQEFQLENYMEMVDNKTKEIFPEIAPHIKILGIHEHDTRIIKSCRNVESLRINYRITRSAAREINSWITESKIKSLWFKSCDNISALLNGVTDLQELEISYFHRNTERIIAKNTNLERLSIELNENNSCRAFRKLQALQSLHIRTSDVEYLNKIQKFGNFENLTEFSLDCEAFNDDPQIIYSFMKHLAEKSKLEKLQLVDCALDDGIFAALKSFNLTTLSLCSHVSTQDLTNFILANPSTHLKHLKLSSCFSDQLLILIAKWTSLETICFYVDDNDEHRKIRKCAFIKKILKTSINRSPLRLHVMVSSDSKLPVHTEIYIDFCNQQIKKIDQNNDFCCSTSKMFSFSSKECFSFSF